MTAPQRSRPSRATSHSAFGKVLDTVLTFGDEPLNQRQVAKLADVSEGTVTRTKTSRNGTGGLLTSTPVRFSADMGVVLAVSVGAEHVRAGLVDANGVLHHKSVTEPVRDQLALPQRELMRRVTRVVADAIRDALQDPQLRRVDRTLPIFAAAMALPTPIDRTHRQINGALTHDSWDDRAPYATLNHAFAAALGPLFSDRTAQVMNDCNAASVALAFDRTRKIEKPRSTLDPDTIRERSTVMVVRVGGGVGCGIIEIASDPDEIYRSRFLKSRVMVGSNALAGEIGHMPISESAVDSLNRTSKDVRGLRKLSYNRKCACGRLHHLQALIGAEAFATRIGVSTRDNDRPLNDLLESVLQPASGQANQAAERALHDSGVLLGRALVGPVLALDLKAMTVIGALARPNLIKGLAEARNDWSKAFFTGSEVELTHPGSDSQWTVARGAGLALIRTHRHRKFREIGKDGLECQLPALPVDLEYAQRIRVSNWG